MQLALDVVAEPLAVCRLEADAPVPEWATGPIASVTRTTGELSVVCAAARVPPGIRSRTGWRALAVRGPLAFELTGVLSSLLEPLASAGITVFAVSTYDTDYVLVPETHLVPAVAALRSAGHEVVGDASP